MDIRSQLVHVRVGVQQIVDGRLGVGGRPGEVVVVGERADIGAIGGSEREQAVDHGGVPRRIARRIGQAEAGVGDAGADGIGEAEPLVEVGVGVPRLRVADGRAEAVGFVADLEVFKAWAEGLADEGGLVRGQLRRVGAEVDAVEAVPIRGVEEAAQVADGLGGDVVDEVGWRVAHFVRPPGARRRDGLGRRLPEAVVRGVAAQAQHAPAEGNRVSPLPAGRERAELLDQPGVRGREEVRLGELLRLVRQADEVDRNRRPCLVRMQDQRRGDRRGVLRLARTRQLRRGTGGAGPADDRKVLRQALPTGRGSGTGNQKTAAIQPLHAKKDRSIGSKSQGSRPSAA